MLRGYVFLKRALNPLRQPAAWRETTCVVRARWASTKASTEYAVDGTVKTKRRRAAKVKNAVAIDQDEAPKKKRGRPRKTPAAEEETEPDVSGNVTALPSSPARPRRRRLGATTPDLPPRLQLPASANHTSLTTFLAYARRKNLSPTGNVFRGTHYEYTCMRTLSGRDYNFELYRTGKAGDLGVDLVGWWKLPEYGSEGKGEGEGEAVEGGKKKRSKKTWRKLKVLAQCKIGNPRPAMIRELEGAYIGAPAGWSSSLALLISTNPATKGVLAALQRSRWPMGLVQMTREGEVKQFLWNAVARESGLEGMGVVVRYSRGKGEEKEEVKQSVRLSWLGRVWRA